jgi:hypothetical protein
MISPVMVALIAVSSVTLSPNDVASGASSTGTVNLDLTAKAPVTVQLSTSTPAVATVPASVTVGGKSRQATFPVSSVTGSAGCSLISAHFGTTATRSALLYVEPPTPNPNLKLTLSANTTIGGSSVTGSLLVTVNSSFPATTVQLVGSTEHVTVPASVTLRLIEGGIGVATFNIGTSTVPGQTCAVITATHNGVQSRALLKLNPFIFG